MSNFQTYSLILCAIDNRLQLEEQKLVFTRAANEPVRLEVHHVLPTIGPEFDPKPYLGTEKQFVLSLFRTIQIVQEWDPDAAFNVKNGVLSPIFEFKAKIVGWRVVGGVGVPSSYVTQFEES